MFKLVENNESNAVIKIPAWARPHEIFAAEELVSYIKKMSRCELQIEKGLKEIKTGSVVIADLSVTASRTMLTAGIGEELKYDGYRITVLDGTLYIVAGEPGGLVFGVYEYLRKICGCGFFDYGARGETVPLADNITHEAVDILDNPACWYRAMQIGVADEPEEVLEKRLDWMAKNGYSHVLVYYGNSNKCLVDGLFSKDPDTDWVRYRDWFIPALQKRGIKICFGHHNFGMLLPEGEYLEQRPDFYALIDGERKRPGQLDWCLTNEELIGTVAERLLELIEVTPESDAVSLWPNDGLAPVCQCEECRKIIRPEDEEELEPGVAYPGRWGRKGLKAKQRLYLYMANQVAEKLAKVYPQKKLSIIAYGDLTEPPLTDIEIHPNIVVHLAIYWRCQKHELSDESCMVNRQFKELTENWLKVLPDPAALVFTTYEQGMGCWKSLPWPAAQYLFKDWAWAKEKGIGGFKTNASTRNHAVYNFNYTAQARSVREDPVTYDEMAEEFCTKFYGKAAGKMQEMYNLWEDAMQTSSEEHIDPSPHEFINKIFTEEVIGKCYSLCEEALGLTDNPLERYRIERMRTLMDYTVSNCKAPAQAIVDIHQRRNINEEDFEKIKKWVFEEAEIVNPSIARDDDLFGSKQNSLGYLDRSKRWLQRIEEADGKIDN
ncbi:MAG: DUF4838 domain-containing protein [Planctomycetota bacterium]|jgi:hypothetical protein